MLQVKHSFQSHCVVGGNQTWRRNTRAGGLSTRDTIIVAVVVGVVGAGLLLALLALCISSKRERELR